MRILITAIALFLIELPLMAAPSVYVDASSFFERFASLAQEEMKNNGIPASIKLGQAALESNFGRSELAVNANNYFGIKCRGEKDCTSKVYQYKDDDYDSNGKLIPSTFMAFNTPNESFRMHTHFLKTNMKRYGKLFDLGPKDYKAWARGLSECGYATDPKYADKLIATIEKHNLQQYDAMVSNNSGLLANRNNKLDMLDVASLAPQRIPDKTIEEPVKPSVSYATANPNKKETRIPVAPENIKMDNQKRKLQAPKTQKIPMHVLEAEMKKTTNVKNHYPKEYEDIFKTDDVNKKGVKTSKATSKRKMMGGNSAPR